MISKLYSILKVIFDYIFKKEIKEIQQEIKDVDLKYWSKLPFDIKVIIRHYLDDPLYIRHVKNPTVEQAIMVFKENPYSVFCIPYSTCREVKKYWSKRQNAPNDKGCFCKPTCPETCEFWEFDAWTFSGFGQTPHCFVNQDLFKQYRDCPIEKRINLNWNYKNSKWVGRFNDDRDKYSNMVCIIVSRKDLERFEFELDCGYPDGRCTYIFNLKQIKMLNKYLVGYENQLIKYKDENVIIMLPFILKETIIAHNFDIFTNNKNIEMSAMIHEGVRKSLPVPALEYSSFLVKNGERSRIPPSIHPQNGCAWMVTFDLKNLKDYFSKIVFIRENRKIRSWQTIELENQTILFERPFQFNPPSTCDIFEFIKKSNIVDVPDFNVIICFTNNAYPGGMYGWQAHYSHYTYNFSKFNKKNLK